MYLLLRLLSFCFCRLPHRAALGLGVALGWIWHTLIPVRRAVVRENLRYAFPEWSESRRRRVARDCYLHWGRSAAELLRLPVLTPKRNQAWIERCGFEHLEAARRAGRGVIAACAHFGNFELLACAEAMRGLPLAVISRRQHAAGVERFWRWVRQRFGLEILPANTSILDLDRRLRRGAVLGVVFDQHMPPGRGIPVEFFGRPASTTPLPAALAVGTGAALLPVRIEHLGGGRHRAVVEPPLPVRRTGDARGEIARLTRSLNAWLEERIRERPEQWLWQHRRWKRLPPNPFDPHHPAC